MEVQAQNERAINITLDEFSGKFDQQNKTVKGAKESLDKQLLYQIIFYASGLLLFLLILWIGIQLGIKKAMKQQSHKWNEFNVEARLIYRYVGVNASYRLTEYIKGDLPELPRWWFGISFALPFNDEE